MNKIEQYLNLCARMYYAGTPIVSDEVFDRLAESIGYTAVGTSKQHDHIEKHYFQMYSLQKHYEDEGKKSPLEGERDIDISPKLDGAACSLLYINGELARALTRGNGVEGTVVTEKFLATNLVPHKVGMIDGILQVTGELVAPKLIENARNYASGALNLKDVEEFKTRTVTFVAYGVQLTPTDTFQGDMRVLKHWGFDTIKDPDLHNIFPCDGLVFRLNSNEAFYGAGYTSSFPKGAYALKERGVAVETTLLDVVWQTGKSGKVTPVAILDPVYVGDKLVSRATLNNVSFIRALDINLGDTIGVILGGEVIPVITHKIE